MRNVFAEAVVGAVDRLILRLNGGAVTPKEYKMLWAETTESGEGQITQITTGQDETEPPFRLIARKQADGQWAVLKEKLVFDAATAMAQQMNQAFAGISDRPIRPFIYKLVKNLGLMDEASTVALLRASDSTVRFMGHISGLTHGEGHDDDFDHGHEDRQLQVLAVQAGERMLGRN